MLSGVNVSYKSVERLYSDERTIITLHTIMLRDEGVRQSDATGDGTGYSLTITKHYNSFAGKRGRRTRNSLMVKEG